LVYKLILKRAFQHYIAIFVPEASNRLSIISLLQKRHQPEPVPFVGGDGGIRTHVPG
jgi:hypothetical protein